MKRKHFLMLFAAGLMVACQPKPGTQPVAENMPGLPFEMPAVQVPVFKTDTLNIEKLGAVADGQTLNTAVINKAIEDCSASGGGVVLVPAGIWLTGPIVLKSNVNLHLASGALLQFTDQTAEYPLLSGYYEGLAALRCQSPISGRNLENIAITGDGIVDGAGQAWRQVKKSKLTEGQWNELVASGGIPIGDTWYPSQSSVDYLKAKSENKLPAESNLEANKPYHDFFRPVMVSLIGCKKVLLDGPTFQNSPAWNLHPLMCEHITLRNLTVRNPWYSQNGDGVDLESCRIGLVENCSFDVGDDAICIKSGKDKEGRDRGMPTELFVIRDCVVYHGHGGFVVGSEMSGGVRKMYVSNCTFIGTDCGLRFKSLRGRGGVVEDIYMDNIRMTNIPTEAIRFNLFYGGKMPSEEAIQVSGEGENIPVTEETPQFRNFHFSNIICRGAQAAMLVQGLPEMPVKGLVLENIDISAETGIVCNYGENIRLKNFKLQVKKGNPVSVYNSKKLVLDGCPATGSQEKYAKIRGSQTAEIEIINSGVTAEDMEVDGNLANLVKVSNH